MSAFQVATIVGVPVMVLIVMLVLFAVARPDQDRDGDGIYAMYLATAAVTTLYLFLVTAAGIGEGITRHFAAPTPDTSFSDGSVSVVSSAFFGFADGSDASLAAFATVALSRGDRIRVPPSTAARTPDRTGFRRERGGAHRPRIQRRGVLRDDRTDLHRRIDRRGRRPTTFFVPGSDHDTVRDIAVRSRRSATAGSWWQRG